jgi:hypothetical protein
MFAKTPKQEYLHFYMLLAMDWLEQAAQARYCIKNIIVTLVDYVL